MIVGIVCFSGQISQAFFQAGTVEYAYSVDCLLIIPYFVLPGVLLRIIMSAYQTLGHTNVSVGLTISENVIAAMNLPVGGEVITTPFTFASTTHAIVRNGLNLVFCDSHLHNQNLLNMLVQLSFW